MAARKKKVAKTHTRTDQNALKRGKKPRNGVGPDMPTGYRKVEAAAMAGFWKPSKRGDRVYGVIGKRVVGTGFDGKPNVFYQLILNRDDVGPFSLDGEQVECGAGQLVGINTWAMLYPFLKENEGEDVFIAYDGDGEARAGKHPPKLFLTGVRSGADHD